MPSPFLEGCPKILITTVLVSKTETGTEFYNYLTLFLKCSINLPSFIVKKKKKKKPLFLKKLHLKEPCLLSCPFLSLIPPVRGTQPRVKSSDLGQKDLRGGLRKMAARLFFLFLLISPRNMCFCLVPYNSERDSGFWKTPSGGIQDNR